MPNLKCSHLQSDLLKRIENANYLIKNVGKVSGTNSKVQESIKFSSTISSSSDLTDGTVSVSSSTDALENNSTSATSKYLNKSPEHHYARSDPYHVFGFDDLPDSLLINIFSFLGCSDLRRVVPLVCRKWYKIAKNPALWTSLKFTEASSTNFICKMLRNYFMLRKLVLFKIKDAPTVIRQLCRSNCNLTVLHVKHCVNSEIGQLIKESVFLNILVCCKNLEELSLKGCHFKAKIFYQELAAMKNLKRLEIGANPYLKVNDILCVAFNCRSLNKVSVSRRNFNQHLTDQHLSFIFSPANMAARITSLKFDAQGLSDRNYEIILNCTKLEELTLNNAINLTSTVFKKIPRKLPNLKRLKIRQAYDLMPEDFINIFTDDKDVLQNITHLDFTACWKMDDEALKSIVQCTYKNLVHLSVYLCKGLEDISVVRKCKQLRYLNIGFVSNLNDTSLELLFENLPKLNTLVIHQDNIFTKTFKNIKASCNSLNIVQSLSQYKKWNVVWTDEIGKVKNELRSMSIVV